ncbi:MAG: hypothetical protein HY759_00090 [Nitrospirae bacterium]|nr:hypothetical protein [Nitrospirota bacterium]
MRKTTIRLTALTVLFSFLGCAAAPKNVPLTKKNLTTVPYLKVVRFKTPGSIRVSSLECTLMSAGIGTVLFPGVGTAVGALASIQRIGRDEIPRPDFGKLVLEKFIRRALKDIPDWPEMSIEEEPVKEEPVIEHITDEPFMVWPPEIKETVFENAILEFMVHGISIDTVDMELSITTTAILKDPHGKVLWGKSFTYRGGDFKRKYTMREFTADNGEILKEELEYAAEATAADFIEHFKGTVTLEKPS